MNDVERIKEIDKAFSRMKPPDEHDVWLWKMHGISYHALHSGRTDGTIQHYSEFLFINPSPHH